MQPVQQDEKEIIAAFRTHSAGRSSIDAESVASLAWHLGLTPLQSELPSKLTPRVTQPEFVRWANKIRTRQRQDTSRDVGRIFESYDPHATGFVSAAVLRMVLKCTGEPLKDDQITTILRELVGGQDPVPYHAIVARLMNSTQTQM